MAGFEFGVLSFSVQALLNLLNILLMREYHAPFENYHFYHIYNHVVGDENLFKEKRNYLFFLNKWVKYLDKYVETWSYCLMPNHIHFLLRVRSQEFYTEDIEVNSFLESQFKRLFSSYALSFNKVYDRKGSLFQKRFKRIKVDSESYLIMLIHYIHHNPIHHKFTNDYSNWSYSSYKAFLSKKPTKVSREKVSAYFGVKKNFFNYHEQNKDYHKIRHLLID